MTTAAGVPQQIRAVVTAVQSTLGPSVLGIYHYGSAVTGGLKPLSDLDFLVIVDRSTSPAQRRHLVRKLLDCSGSGASHFGARPVEVTVVRHDSVKPGVAPAEREFQYGEWLRAEYEAGTMPEPAPDHDLALLLSAALIGSHALVGPPLSKLLDPVPADDLRSAMQAAVPGLLDELSTDTRNVLLTLARMWYTTCTGDFLSKDAAATWAGERVPSELRPVLAHAGAVYLGDEEEAFSRFEEQVLSIANLLAQAVSASTVQCSAPDNPARG